MSTTNLRSPITDGQVRTVNFFNGRLLSAEDMTAERSAAAEMLNRLGRAVGDGIVEGLNVSLAASGGAGSNAIASVLTVEAGAAVSPRGQTLALPVRTDVSVA